MLKLGICIYFFFYFYTKLLHGFTLDFVYLFLRDDDDDVQIVYKGKEVLKIRMCWLLM